MSRNIMLTEEQNRLNARLEAHMVYICPECGKAFRTQVEWRQHLNTKHDYLKKTYSDFNFIQIDERFHECQLCFKWVENAHKTIALLQYHYFMHLAFSQTYRCVHCRMAYTRRRALNVHLLDTHMREIEKYEAKLRQMKRNQEQKAAAAAAAAAIAPKTKSPPVARQATRKRKDLLEKALMDIDLLTEEEKLSASGSPAKPNPSELNLDRCLNAYEDIVRKEEADLDALCKEFFEEKLDNSKADKKKTEKTEPDTEELVIIEIDALGKDEVDQLQKEMKPDVQAAKRRRLSESERESDSEELSANGLKKLISYLCPKCGKEIASMDDWRTHVFKKHDFEHYIENSFKIIEAGRKSMCLQCHEMQPTTKRSELQKHCFKHLPYRSYLKCSLCKRTKTSMSKMYNHIRHNHQEELQRKNKTQLLIKPEPKAKISPKQRPTAVIKRENEQEEGFICEHCSKTYKTCWRYQQHLAICKRAGILKPQSQSALDAGFDAIIKHLREGNMRMNAIWRT